MSAGPVQSLFSPQPTALEVAGAKVFEEPLAALGAPSPDEVRDLALALDAYVAGGKLEATAPIAAFLQAYPNSPWRLSLLVNLGLMQRHTGQVSLALASWEAAWALGKDLKTPVGIALANRALGELFEANAGLGRRERLEALVMETEGRPLSGLVTEKVSGAKESLAYMTYSPETAFRCGPTALAFLKATRSPLAFADPVIHKMYSTEQGTTLTMNARWAAQIGLALQMAKRHPGATLPVPGVIHLNTGHFAAVMAARNGQYLIQDPFLGDTWVSLATLDQEGSGYALVPAGALAQGWAAVSEGEGDTVWGKGAWGPGRPDDTRPDSVKMATSLALKPDLPIKPAYHADLVSLNLDVPVVSYAPIRGPRVDFTVTYNQREYGQPQLFDYCNLGPKWTFSFLACIKDDSTQPDADVAVCNPGGGGQVFHGLGDGTFLPENNTQARLSRLPGNGYLIAYPSGRQEFYELADRAWGLRRVVLTRVQDPFGNSVRLTWNALLQLVAVQDAAGKTTTIAYEAPGDPLKITRVTDPFGRTTRFQYDATGMLAGIVDSQGRVTNFAYGPRPEDPGVPMDFLRSLATSRGGFTFSSGEKLVGPSYRRWIEAVGPSGDRERLEAAAGYAYEVPPEKLPLVPELDPAYHPLAFRFRESWFWPSGALDGAKLDYHKASHIRWGHGPGAFSSGIVLSRKEPTGPRHWFVHTGDFWGGVFRAARSVDFPLTPGGTLKPGARIVNLQGTEANKAVLAPVFDGNRALLTRDIWVDEAGALRRQERDLDTQGRLVHEADGFGHVDAFAWSEASDLVRAALAGSQGSHSFTFNDQHRLVAWLRPDGRTWKGTYSADGRLQGWKDGKAVPWELRYDNQGRLQAASHQGRTWTFTFDPLDRIQAVKDPKGVVHDLTGGFGNETQPRPVPGTKAGSPGGGDAYGMASPVRVPRGCDQAFAGLLDGVNGPLIGRLMAIRDSR